MCRWIMFLAVALTSLQVHAIDSFQTGAQTLRVNDAESALIEALGQPSRKVEMANSRGDHVGDYYYYTLGNKTMRFLVRNGRIIEIYEMH